MEQEDVNVGHSCHGERPEERSCALLLSRESETLVGGWGRELTAAGGRGRTVRGLLGQARRFLAWLEEEGGELASMSEEIAWSYQQVLLERPHARHAGARSRNTVAAEMQTVRRFGDWLVGCGVWLSNPVRAVEAVRMSRNPPLGLPREEQMGRFLEALADWEAEDDLRNRMWAYRVHVMAEVQYASGLRMSELGALLAVDLDLSRYQLWVREGKGGERRAAYLTIWATDLLREYLSMRALVVKGGARRNRYLFGPTGEHLARAYNKRLNLVAERVGLGRFYNHLFRHALGYHLLRAGCPIRSIQSILGHRKLSSTEIYTKVDAEDVRGILDAHHPRAI